MIRMKVRRDSPLRATIPLAACLFAIAGCTGADLSGYKAVDQTTNITEAAATNDKALAVETTSTTESLQSDPSQSSDRAANADSLEDTLPVSAIGPVNVVDGASIAALMKVTATAVSPAEPRKVEVLITEKTFRPDPASKALRVSYDDLDLLKVLNMEPVTIDAIDHMPAWLKGLDGQRIKIRGFMFPTYETEGIERFVLARDNQICCFGRDPKVYDLVQVDMKPGKTTRYIPATRAFDVVGRLRFEMVAADNKPFGLYFLEEAEVIDR
jgi:hypothetical protein